MSARVLGSGSRAVVFGGRGFLGSHVVAELVERGATVVSFDLEARPDAVTDGVEHMVGDITDAVAVKRAVRRADHVFAFAGGLGPRGSLQDPMGDFLTGCLAQVILLEAVREHSPSASVVFPGSRLEYGKPDYLPVDEAHPLRGDSPYAVNKTTCASYHRLYAQRYGLHTTVLRLPNPYGSHVVGAPEQRLYGILNLFIDRALAGRPIQLFGDGSQLRDFVHADDVVSAVLLAATIPQAAGEVLNVGSGEPHSLREAAELVVSSSRSGSVETGVEWPEDAAVIETGDFYFSCSKAREILGWQPRIPLAEGVVRVVDETRRSLREHADD